MSRMTFFWAYCLFSIALGFAVGFATSGHNVATSAKVALDVAILGVLELSMSFDNAAINATILEKMPPKWRRLFIVFGMPFAVFFIRGILPVLILSAALWVNPVEAVRIAFTDPARYHAGLESVNGVLMVFGASFLMPVALEFFLDPEKDLHWIDPLEKLLLALHVEKLSWCINYVYTFLAILVTAYFSVEPGHLIIAGLIGMSSHFLIGLLGDQIGDPDDLAKQVGAMGFSGLMYLELIDASMSFDGVIGAFAISTNPIVILLGLGVGAFAVRNITLSMVEHKSLAKYRYLAHGAFWAILVLVGLMMLSADHEAPSALASVVSAVLVISAFATSVFANRREDRFAAQEHSAGPL